MWWQQVGWKGLRKHRGRLVRIHDRFGSGARHLPRELSRENQRGSGAAVFERMDALGIEHEPVRPQRHFDAFGQGRCLDALSRDPGAILATEVGDDVVVVLPSEFRMEPRDAFRRILEHQVVLWRPADPQRVFGDGALPLESAIPVDAQRGHDTTPGSWLMLGRYATTTV